MMRIGMSIAFLFVSWLAVKGQDLQWVSLYDIQVDDLNQISLDNREQIIYADDAGNVFKINREGKLENQYSPISQAKLNQLEAFWTVNIFLFSADMQQCIILDVNLNPISIYSIQHENIGIVKAATLGNNNIFWFFDEVDLSLIQYDFQRNLVLQDQPMSLLSGGESIEVLEMKERQNLIFMNIKNQGLYIFDNQGNFLKKFEFQLSQKINIYENNLYFMNQGFIHRINIHTGREERFKSPDLSLNKILVSANQVIFYSPTLISLYAKPGYL